VQNLMYVNRDSQ